MLIWLYTANGNLRITVSIRGLSNELENVENSNDKNRPTKALDNNGIACDGATAVTQCPP